MRCVWVWVFHCDVSHWPSEFDARDVESEGGFVRESGEVDI